MESRYCFRVGLDCSVGMLKVSYGTPHQYYILIQINMSDLHTLSILTKESDILISVIVSE
jgi:hypothetical protein